MARFEKGRAKTGGMQKGWTDPAKRELRKLLSDYAIDNFPSYVEAIEALRLKDTLAYVRAYNEMLRHVLPALQSVALNVTSQQSESITQHLLSMADKASDKEDKTT